MSHHDKFSNESQDARRNDQGKAVHPTNKYGTAKISNDKKTGKRKKK
jgi:hypothetical protein